MENIPEKFLNDDGTLNSDALIKSYAELEKKMGAMVSVPGADADFDAREKFNRAIGVPADAGEYPMHDLFDDESVRTRFCEIGLTKTQAEKIYEMAEEFLCPVLSEIFQTGREADAVSELQKFFGSQDKMLDALKEINAFGEKFLPLDAFESLCATPQGIKSVHKMMQSMEPSVETEKNSSAGLSDAELRRMMRHPKYWRERDPEYVRKIENGFKKLYS
ncbi:MAG: hypothetical protein LBJ73_02720 [Rickettsiales bacterium]|jgi:hypothetical protein|nr:hypothetical protein [Rickettsiales bacterium]